MIMASRLHQFSGGDVGAWRVIGTDTVVGPSLPDVKRIDVASDPQTPAEATPTWSLRGMLSNARYVVRAERTKLLEIQPQLGRPESTRAALIPMSKSAAWWDLTQDERRTIFEEKSRHIGLSLRYLPAVARGVYHCRDLSESEPFEFLAWFEFASADEAAFNQMLAELRATEEWHYVTREIDIRLVRD